MADFAGVVYESLLLDSTHAMTAPRFRYEGDFASLEALAGDKVAGSYVAVGSGHPASPAGTNFAGYVGKEETVGFDWFDKVHLIPRTKFEFGTIVTQVTDTFEIFSAWSVPISLNSFTNPIAGVSVPDLPAPVTILPPFTSFLDPASTRLNRLPIELVVDRDGQPAFDDVLSFFFSTGETLLLALSGSRVSLITPVFEYPFLERLSFLSDEIEALSGKSQVLGLRGNSRQMFAVSYKLDAVERQRMQATLFGSQPQTLALPLWHEEVRSTAAVIATATTVAVSSTTAVDFRVGGFGVIFESATKFDVLVFSAVGANSLTFVSTPLLNAYSSNAQILPVRLVAIVNEPTGTRYLNRLEGFSVNYSVLDNDTGMFAGSLVGWNTYNGKVILDECNAARSTVPESFAQRVTVIDNGTGKISVGTSWDRHKRETMKTFLARTPAEILKLKKLLIALDGRRVSFYLPTQIEDLTVVANLANASTVMDISHIGYTKNVQNREPKATFRITFTDDTHLERTITASTELSSTVERLTINTAWPADRTLAEIERVEFLELVRFATDDFNFQHDEPGRARLAAPVKVKFA